MTYSYSHHSSTGIRRIETLLMSAVLAFCVFIAFAPTAQATQAHFCGSPPDGGVPITLASGASCTGTGHSVQVQVKYFSAYTNENLCAVGKQTAAGGGSNVIPVVCAGPANYVTTACVSPRTAYPKGINQGPTSGDFFGVSIWTSGCW